MFKNYLKIALRNLLRQKGYSFINIAGLAVGMACCLLIIFYVQDELSYDRFHENAERFYRVAAERHRNTDVRWSAWSPVPMGPALRAEIPEVTEAIRFWRAFQPVISYEDKHFREKKFYFTDPAVFAVFSFELSKGDRATALAAPGTVVITETSAKKYFGAADPIGKTLRYVGYPADTVNLVVTGVLRDLPHYTQFEFDFLASLLGVETEQDNWGSTKPIWTYVLLPENYSPNLLESKLPAFVERHFTSANSSDSRILHLEPLRDIHLYSRYEGGFKSKSDIAYVYLFSAIGFFILLIACINFMNLATARSLKRAREVGMRKVLGAQRAQLVKQFLGEAFLLGGLALLLALVLVEMLLPHFNAFTGKAIAISYFRDEFVLAALLGIVLLAGLLAGSYPAFFLSRFKPIVVLKGASLRGANSGSLFMRKGLVAFQFAISIVLIIATAVVYRQLDYVRNMKLGFDEEQVVVLPYSENERPLLTALAQHPSVLNVSVSQRVPVNTVNADGRTVRIEGSDDPIRVESYLIDDAFLDTYRIELVTGRNLSRIFASDSAAFLLNETAVKAFGWNSPAEALGKRLTWSGWKTGAVIGVIKDFHMSSMHEAIEPLVLHTIPQDRWWRTFISVRLRPDNLAGTLNFLETTWRTFTPNGAYEYFFVDDSFDELHRADQRFGQIFGYFAALAVIIACLGLFGLAAYAAEQRTKEIGVRKVLGASIASVVMLLSKDFLKLVGIGFTVASPLAYFAMNRWLQDFAYRIQMGPEIFVAAGLMALLIAGLTVFYQSLKAALANPAEALRYE
ncbi:ABC transporter permease [candidate division KSB1 bacterium]|nr:ABC transporter permease [candidate division KSB1 bacterium]